MKIESSFIKLNNLRIHAFHGVAAQETIVGNEFIINLTLKVNLEQSGKSDLLENTVSYADVFETVNKEMKIPSKLLEHVAYRICKQLLTSYKMIEHIKIELDKNVPPMGADIDSAGVVLNCSR